MSRNNTIGIVGRVTVPPKLISDAPDYTRKVYETVLVRQRPSGTEDTYILQFDGHAAGSEETFKEIKAGVEVVVAGEIRTENVCNPKPEENRVKIYIYAEAVVVNNPPADDQNEVKICGYICKKPRLRETRRKTKKGKRLAATSLMVVESNSTHTNYIPCVCWGWMAYGANTLDVGEHVEIYGRFQSRAFVKQIEGNEAKIPRIAYEVSVLKLENGYADSKNRKGERA